MSDAIEKTAAGATRVLFGTIAFICLMVGIEGMTGVEKISIGLAALLIGIGAICAYAAAFWETAKRVLSKEAQEAIGAFSRHKATKAALLFAVLIAIVMSPFIEQHRWPFSYPTDPQIYLDKASAEQKLNDANRVVGQQKELADKWRFSKELRDTNAKSCHYQLASTNRTSSTLAFWSELLQVSGWIGDGRAPTNMSLIQPGITLRIAGDASDCANALQRGLTDIYPNPTSKIVQNQQINCGKDCVIIEMDY